MNSSAWRGVRIAVVLFLSALFQSVFSDAWSIRGARPDFLLSAIVICSLFTGANGGSVIGFFGGLLYASVVSPPHWAFAGILISRTLLGAGVGWLEDRIFRNTVLLVVPLVLVGTVLSELLFYLFSPQHNYLLWARTIGWTTLYNGVIAAPLFFLISFVIKFKEEKTTP